MTFDSSTDEEAVVTPATDNSASADETVSDEEIAEAKEEGTPAESAEEAAEVIEEGEEKDETAE